MNCHLCNSKAKIIPPQGAYSHIDCKNCGEYKMTFASSHLINENNKYLLSGMICNRINKNEPFLITKDIIKNILSPLVQEKFFYLGKFIFEKTKLLGIGSKINDIPLNCCYAKNSDEFLQLVKQLKELGIIDFELYENGGACVIFTDICMQISAYSKFETGIDSTEKFKECFMDQNKKIEQLNIFDNSGNIAFASGHAHIIQNTEVITESDLIKTLLGNGIQINTIDQIREDLTDLITEYNKDKLDQNKLTNIFMKLRNIGGKILLSGLTLLIKPEVIQLIENVRNLT